MKMLIEVYPVAKNHSKNGRFNIGCEVRESCPYNADIYIATYLVNCLLH